VNNLEFRPLFRIRLDLGTSVDAGATPYGRRRVFPVVGGRFDGDRLRGAVLPETSGDWLLQRQDGAFQQDVRLLLRTDDGALVFMNYRGVRRPASEEVNARIARGEPVDRKDYYLRIVPFFETASEKYAWLNQIVAVGVGERIGPNVAYDVFEIL
jgi:Protein of unknown function (DUF3237)